MSDRNQRRLINRKEMKHREDFIKGLDPLKRFIYKGLANKTITKNDLAQFAQHFLETEMTKELAVLFLKKEILLELTDEAAIEHLGNRYTITKNKTENENGE